MVGHPSNPRSVSISVALRENKGPIYLFLAEERVLQPRDHNSSLQGGLCERGAGRCFPASLGFVRPEPTSVYRGDLRVL